MIFHFTKIALCKYKAKFQETLFHDIVILLIADSSCVISISHKTTLSLINNSEYVDGDIVLWVILILPILFQTIFKTSISVDS